MFGKLMKHEMIATGRAALPVLGAMLLLSALSRLAAHAPDGFAIGMFFSAASILHVLSYVAVPAAVAVLLVQRFRKSVLGEEGYLTMTLPVSLHAVLCAKALTAVFWCVVTAALAAVSVAVASAGISGMDHLLRNILRDSGVFSLTAGEGALAAAEGLAAVLQAVLLFYAAMAVGHSFHSHKGLLSAAAFFALNGVARPVILGLLYSVFRAMDLSAETTRVLALTLGGTLLFSALLYALTWYCLSRRLNLE